MCCVLFKNVDHNSDSDNSCFYSENEMRLTISFEKKNGKKNIKNN